MHKPVSRVAVWIDHASAHVVELKDDGTAETTTIASNVEEVRKGTGHVTNLPPHGGGGGLGDREHTGTERRSDHAMAAFLEKVAGRIAKTDQLLILGHGQVPAEFANVVRIREPKMQIKGVEALDRLTGPELEAHVRERFRTPAERLMPR